jgi:hypothetical protein
VPGAPPRVRPAPGEGARAPRGDPERWCDLRLKPSPSTGAVSPAATPGVSPPGDVRACPPSSRVPDSGPSDPGSPPAATPARTLSAASLRNGAGVVDAPGRGVVGPKGNSPL